MSCGNGFDNAVIFTFTLVDDTAVQVVVSSDSVDLAQGPFTAGADNEAVVNPTSQAL